MQRIALGCLVVGGCLWNPSVEVDRASVDVPRGTSTPLTVTVEGEPDIAEVVWTVDDPAMVTVLAVGDHLSIGGNLEGLTVVHVNTHGITRDVAVHVGPPAIARLWIEPAFVATNVGSDVAVRALALDTVAQIVDVSRDCEWSVTDRDVATLDMAGMTLQAKTEGETTLHVANGDTSAVVPVAILK